MLYLSNNTLEREQIKQLLQPEKQKKFIVLPYCNYKAENFATRLTKLVNDNFEQIDFKIAFKAPNEIGKKFPFKDNIKESKEQSLVVYKIKCQTCNEIYIGKTERILARRIKEHNGKNSESAIRCHKEENPRHIIDASDIEIIDKADNNFKLMIKEMLHINKMKPMLDIQKKKKQRHVYITAKHHHYSKKSLTRLYVHYYNTPYLVKHKYSSYIYVS